MAHIEYKQKRVVAGGGEDGGASEEALLSDGYIGGNEPVNESRGLAFSGGVSMLCTLTQQRLQRTGRNGSAPFKGPCISAFSAAMIVVIMLFIAPSIMYRRSESAASLSSGLKAESYSYYSGEPSVSRELQESGLRGVDARTLCFVSTDSIKQSAHIDILPGAIGSMLQPSIKKQILPVVVLSGGGTPSHYLLNLYKNCDIILVQRNISFLAELEKVSRERAQAVYMRLDFNAIIDDTIPFDRCIKYSKVQYEYSMYIDVDAMFLKSFDISKLPKPRVMLVGPEGRKGQIRNTGVMYINTAAFKRVFKKMLAFAIKHKFSFPAYDQGLVLSYFNITKQLERLPDEYNWKPYWGMSSKACIVHFHGFKPYSSTACLTNNPNALCEAAHENTQKVLMESCGKSVPASTIAIYQRVLEGAQKSYGVSLCQQAKAYVSYDGMFRNFRNKAVNHHRI